VSRLDVSSKHEVLVGLHVDLHMILGPLIPICLDPSIPPPPDLPCLPAPSLPLPSKLNLLSLPPLFDLLLRSRPPKSDIRIPPIPPVLAGDVK